MARTLPVPPDLSVLHPSFSALASLGLEESVAAIADTTSHQAPQLVPIWVAVEPGLESTEPAPAATPVAPLEPVEADWAAPGIQTLSPADVIDGHVAETQPDLMATLIWVPVDNSVEANVSAASTHGQDDLSFLDRKIDIEFRTDGLDLAAAVAADSMAIDAVAEAARPGGPGGGGGGGGGGAGVLAEYKSGGADGTAGYDILIQFKGTAWTADLQSAFIEAADYFTEVITADIGGGGRIGKIIVDDLYVTAEVKPIDGVGNILGQAGPTNVWTANELTAAGQMQFDVADAQDYFSDGLWDDIVTHELMHVLGIGSLWNYGKNPLVVGDHYNGPNAVGAYDATLAGTQTWVPVETDGGSGTAGSHWDEQALLNELMTGYINNSNYLSKFSVMSLADLGYAVNYFDYPHDQVTIA